MPPYSFQFEYDVNEEVFDTVTNKAVKIIGVSYLNGESLESTQKWFHEEIYLIMFENGYKDARFGHELVKMNG